MDSQQEDHPRSPRPPKKTVGISLFLLALSLLRDNFSAASVCCFSNQKKETVHNYYDHLIHIVALFAWGREGTAVA